MQNVYKLNENCFGLLPLISNGSKYQLGALSTQSFADRINVVENLIVAKEKVSSDFSVIDKLLILRMTVWTKNKNRGNVNVVAGLDEEVWC